MEAISRKKIYFWLPLGSLILAGDQLSKILIRLSDGFYICNPHIAFGLEIPDIVFWIFWAGIVLSILYALNQNLSAAKVIGLIFILSGALSNCIDRIYWGCVTDLIFLNFGPVFNLADLFISLGVIILIISFLKVKR